MINQTTERQSVVMKCFACLLQCEDAHLKCDEVDAISCLIGILSQTLENTSNDPDASTMNAEYAAMALHNCLLSTKSRWRAREFWQLPSILIRHAHSKTNYRLQLHCLQVNLHDLRELYRIEIFLSDRHCDSSQKCRR